MRLKRLLDRNEERNMVERVRPPVLEDAGHLERLLRDADFRLLQMEASGALGELLSDLHGHVVDALTDCSHLTDALGGSGHGDLE